MSKSTTVEEQTLLSELILKLRSCRSTPDGVALPAAILWTDPNKDWGPLIDPLRAKLPEFFILGDYDPERRTGPAIWLRCVVDRTIEVPGLEADHVRILYLPEVSRQQLRAGEACPRELQPLVELMYRGTLWHQRNGYDWTLTAFLTSPDGLGLYLARDQKTLDALPRALREFAVTPLSQVREQRLEADDFDRLLTPDLYRDLLQWLSEPKSWRERMGEEKWASFCSQCRDNLGFDPETDGEIEAAGRLGLAEGAWAEAWARYEEAPAAYPGVPDLLRRSKPSTLLFDRSRWPDENEAAEQSLRAELEKIPQLAHREACERILELEAEHGERRRWIWAKLDQAPLAQILEPLSTLAQHAKISLGGSTPDEVAAGYVDEKWRADFAAVQAMALTDMENEALIYDVVRHLLRTWLEECAHAFQRATTAQPLPTMSEAKTVEVNDGACLVFVDGLRYDLGRALAERLEGRGCRVEVGHRWAGTPTVTATAKPAVTPLAAQIGGAELPDDFAPVFSSDGKPVNTKRIQQALEATGYQLLGEDLGNWPESDRARGWSEFGQIDSLGHKLEVRLVQQIDHELERLSAHIQGLLDGGWNSVRVVTDHGWLLLPRGLPKIDLPKHLTESRWSRCATIAGDSEVSVPMARWYWNPKEEFATAPGISCFNFSPVYAHGGLSIQECLVPDIHVEWAGERQAQAKILDLSWRGMRCYAETEVSAGTVKADLRLGGAAGLSIAASAKVVDQDGKVSLIVPDDEHEGADATFVLLAEDETVLAQRQTKVGEGS